MLNEFLIDEKLKREEQRISKILESICLKSNIKLDADGYPIPQAPPNVSGKLKGSSSTGVTPNTSQKQHGFMSSGQVEPTSPLRMSAFSTDESVNQFDGGGETMGSRATSFSFQQNTSNKAYEQDFIELQNELYEAKQALNETEGMIEDLEKTVLQLFQWKTSFSNFLLMVFYQYEQKMQKLVMESNTFGIIDDQTEMKSMDDGSENDSTIKSDTLSGEKVFEEFQNMISLVKSELFRNTIIKKAAKKNSSGKAQQGKDMLVIPVPKCVEQIVAKKGQSFVLGQLLLPESSTGTGNASMSLSNHHSTTHTVTTTSCLIDFQPLVTICVQCQTRVLKQQLAAPAPTTALTNGKLMPNTTPITLLPTTSPLGMNHTPRIHSPITGYVLPVAAYHVHHDYYTLSAEFEELVFHVFVIFVTATTGLSPVNMQQQYASTGSMGAPSSGGSVASMHTTGTRQTMRGGGMSTSGKFGFGSGGGGSSGASVATGKVSRATTIGAGTRAHSKDTTTGAGGGVKLGKEEIKWYMNKRNFLLFIWLFELCDNRKGLSLQRIHAIFELASLHLCNTNTIHHARVSYEGFIYALAIIAIHHYAPRGSNASSTYEEGYIPSIVQDHAKIEVSFTPFKHQQHVNTYLTCYIRDYIQPKAVLFFQAKAEELLWYRMSQYWILTHDQIYLLLAKYEDMMIQQYTIHSTASADVLSTQIRRSRSRSRSRSPAGHITVHPSTLSETLSGTLSGTMSGNVSSDTPGTPSRRTLSPSSTPRTTRYPVVEGINSPDRRRFLTAMTSTTNFSSTYNEIWDEHITTTSQSAYHQSLAIPSTFITESPLPGGKKASVVGGVDLNVSTSKYPIPSVIQQSMTQLITGLEIFCIRHELCPSTMLPHPMILRRISQYVQETFTGHVITHPPPTVKLPTRRRSPSPNSRKGSNSSTNNNTTNSNSSTRSNSKSPTRGGGRNTSPLPTSNTIRLEIDTSAASATTTTSAAAEDGNSTIHNMYLVNCLYLIAYYISREITPSAIGQTISSSSVGQIPKSVLFDGVLPTTTTNNNRTVSPAKKKVSKNVSNTLTSANTITSTGKLYGNRKATSPLTRPTDTDLIEEMIQSHPLLAPVTTHTPDVKHPPTSSARLNAQMALLARKHKSMESTTAAKTLSTSTTGAAGSTGGAGTGGATGRSVAFQQSSDSSRLYREELGGVEDIDTEVRKVLVLPSMEEEEKLIRIIQYLIATIMKEEIFRVMAKQRGKAEAEVAAVAKRNQQTGNSPSATRGDGRGGRASQNNSPLRGRR